MLDFSLYLSMAAGALVCALLLSMCSSSMFGILQQGGYSGRALVKWYFKKGNMLRRRYALFALFLALLTALLSLCFSFLGLKYANMISAVAFIGLCVLFEYSSWRALKVPLKRTGRVVRLDVCYFVLLLLVCFGMCTGLAFAAQAIDNQTLSLFRFVPVCVMPLILPFVLVCANFIMKAYEAPRNRAYLKRAARAIEGSSCIKVGITGSYAKTSVKHMAAAILSEKFKVVFTPSSYNTPLGIARTVAEHGLDCDIFLAEMGARKTGDIAELCDLVKPDYGVVTGVCAQHLETFGSLENIKKEKSVLASRAAKGCVLGETAKEFSAENALKEGEDFAAENVVCTADGTRFELRLGEEKIKAESKLLGRHAAQDIALAAALAHMLGMSKDEIAAGIARIEPVPHRLQKIENNGLFILDDSYNSNIEGARDAVDTLRLFGGKKYAVTPGLVELGVLEEEANEKLGASLVGLDGVILVGETLVLAVRREYLDAGGEQEKLRIVPSLAEASEILGNELGAGDCVLFLNDLPDIYN